MTITEQACKAFIQQFNTPAVRDLAWSCFSPNLINQFSTEAGNLISSNSLTLSESRKVWLHQLDQHPQPLLEAIAALKSRRLGLYHETLWHFFIANDAELDLIAHNVKVYRDKRTLGEIDVVYFCHTRQTYFHLELAIKYYLDHQLVDDIPLSNWLGPNCNDRFDFKIQRMLDHQIQLSTTPEGISTLLALGIQSIEPEISIKGYLFYNDDKNNNRERQEKADTPLNPLAKHHCQQQWRHMSQFLAEQYSYDFWCHLQKPNWTSPMFTHGDTDAIMTKENLHAYLTEYFDTYERPLMLCGLTQHKERQYFRFHEQERFMITPDQWPF